MNYGTKRSKLGIPFRQHGWQQRIVLTGARGSLSYKPESPRIPALSTEVPPKNVTKVPRPESGMACI